MPRLTCDFRRIASSLTAGLLLVGLLTVALGMSIALTLAPAVLLVVALLHGFAPGEQMIERLRRRFSGGHRRPASRAVHLRLAIVVRRVGRTLASALAMRPPPDPLTLLSV